ncbi:hypothetical protein KUTeg_007018 [Tegillarca granosa]|uniref:Ion transport domain-containing protein n=1 Tax=Tegillarca granosa TaxID=220873 RepID=A0ABQ9FC13_TEGGR|nr:hypothetical protein KUTeg_007018 [Tegillarca granosa]
MDRSVNDLPLDPQWYADTMNEEEVFDPDEETPQNVVIQRGDSDQENLHGHIDDLSLSISSSPTSLKLTKTPVRDICSYNSQVDVKPNGCPNSELDVGGEIDQIGQPKTEYENEQLSILQAVVFIEDAAKGYKPQTGQEISESLQMASFCTCSCVSTANVVIYNLSGVKGYFVIFVLHMLAFIEFPSSLTWTSDVRSRGDRIQIPCGITESIELICLLILLMDTIIKITLIGRHEFLKKKWLLLALIVLVLSISDWLVTIGLSCKETVRFRRILRPFFILQNSNLMKKTVNCLRRTMPEVIRPHRLQRIVCYFGLVGLSSMMHKESVKIENHSTNLDHVLLLLALHLCIFTLLGMLMFPKPKIIGNGNNNGTLTVDLIMKNKSTNSNSTDIDITTVVMMPAYQTNRLYALFFIIFLIVEISFRPPYVLTLEFFKKGNYCFMNMFLAVIYNQFRGYFKDSLQASLLRRRVGVRAAYEVLKDQEHYSSLQDSSSFSSEGVRLTLLENVVKDVKLPNHSKRALLSEMEKCKRRGDEMFTSEQFQKYFDLLETEHYHREKPSVRWFDNTHVRLIQRCIAHRYFNYLGNFIAFMNVIVITIELSTQYDESLNSNKSVLNKQTGMMILEKNRHDDLNKILVPEYIVNFAFVIYYCLEQIVKFIALGWKRYIYERWNIFDGIITIALVLVYVAKYGLPLVRTKSEIHDSSELWNIVRIINILIMVRVLRIIPHIKAMSIVANTLVDLIRNLKAFGGILMAMYYSYAILGIEIFHDTIKYDPKQNHTPGGHVNSYSISLVYECGTYQQLEYWPNNFDDFARKAALVVLWDVMVVNNWSIFLYAYAKVLTKWSYIYFIVWWLISVLIVLNLFTALIIENFIMKWDRNNENDNRPRSESGLLEESIRYMSIHEMFRGNLQEPSEGEILNTISKHRHLNLKTRTLPSSRQHSQNNFNQYYTIFFLKIKKEFDSEKLELAYSQHNQDMIQNMCLAYIFDGLCHTKYTKCEKEMLNIPRSTEIGTRLKGSGMIIPRKVEVIALALRFFCFFLDSSGVLKIESTNAKKLLLLGITERSLKKMSSWIKLLRFVVTEENLQLHKTPTFRGHAGKCPVG